MPRAEQPAGGQPQKRAAPGRPARVTDQRPRADRGSRDAQRRANREASRKARAIDARRARIEALEAEIAEREQAIREIERSMAAPGFYDNRAAAQPIIDRHQSLMWQVGDLMHRWEELQAADDVPTASEA
jgi:hypothetical protein